MRGARVTKTVLVTGASSGIGEATVRRLLADGLSVFAAARRVERMAPLEAAGATPIALDLTDDASMSAAIAAVEREAGRLDVLVNNAGYGSYGALEDVPIEEGRRQFEVNIFGLARLTQLALPMMRAQGSGRIINVSSMGGVMWEPFGAWTTPQVRPGGPQRQPARGAETAGDRRGGHPARGDPHRVVGHRARRPAASLGRGAYAPWARRHARMLKGASASFASPPKVVAETIAGAVRARRPRTRYVTGRTARTFIALRRLLPDRMFDRLMWRVSQGRG